VPQIKQIPVTLIPLDRLLFSVARAFDAALKAKNFTFGGAHAFRIVLYIGEMVDPRKCSS
jgi:hypothetical protein